MLTAIQDFVKDSFSTDSQDDLETLRIGSNKSIWIENGEQALIAAVIRGTPPLDLRTRYRELIEEIHIKSGSALDKFDGDTFPFSIFRESLKEELQLQAKEEKKKTSPLLWCILIIILSISCVWAFSAYQNHQSWNHYIAQLKSQKGVIILSAKKKEGKYQVYGLRDPMAKESESLLQQQKKLRFPMENHWKTYYSLDPEFIFNRAVKTLNPPSTIKLQLSDNIISAAGEAPRAWIDIFRNTATAIPGIDGYNDEMLQDIDKKKQSADRTMLKAILQELTSIKIYFQSNSTKFVKGQENDLHRVVSIIKRIQTLSKELQTHVQIVIMGHTDSSGSEETNLTLSRNRAEYCLNYLIIKGINPASITISGAGNKKPLTKETNIADKSLNRAITFNTFEST